MFLKEFLKNPTRTGALAQSSADLSKLITDTANLDTKKCIVELGSGTGVFTKEILNKINSDSCFFCLESNQEFVKQTQKKCPNAIVYHDSAVNIKKYLLKHNKNNCDCIISGLPWAIFNKKLQTILLNAACESLEADGIFLTFAYVQGAFLPSGINFKKQLRKKFKLVRTTKIIWKNLPPAFVYYCKK
ncbi:SAM-dependent methyltransferase [bacterium]|jgi:phosphatidylethanolamine/phosphatidyl-N-methylethanolamine N-methyltransferase|nr:SAM-dependent methyltransferase [bacterium]MBT4649274.1 SAM-dependent methyltransferase [bacterium]